MVNLWVWEKIFVPISVTLGQSHQATEVGHILPCPHDKVRTAHPIATKFGTYISLVMVSTWLNCRGILFETFFDDFFVKFQMRFWEWDFKVKSGICYISAKNGSIASKQKANISIER